MAGEPWKIKLTGVKDAVNAAWRHIGSPIMDGKKMERITGKD
jgi:hypothetical protein